MVIGLEKGVVRLVAYTPDWHRLFEEEKTALQNKVGEYVLAIQHVGSTSIPGMIAKPIIDIGIAVTDFEEAKVCIPLIEELGYEYQGEFGIPRRHYFRKGDPRTFHVHVCEANSAAWRDLVLFRDHLCKHPQLAEEYARLKMQLADQYPQDRGAYLDGKAEFVERVIRLASDS